MNKSESGTKNKQAKKVRRQAIIKDYLETLLMPPNEPSDKELTIDALHKKLNEQIIKMMEPDVTRATIARDLGDIGFDKETRSFIDGNVQAAITAKRSEIIERHSDLLMSVLFKVSYAPIDWLTLKVEPGHEEGALTSLKKIYPKLIVGGCISRGTVLVAYTKARLPELKRNLHSLINPEPEPLPNASIGTSTNDL